MWNYIYFSKSLILFFFHFLKFFLSPKITKSSIYKKILTLEHFYAMIIRYKLFINLWLQIDYVRVKNVLSVFEKQLLLSTCLLWKRKKSYEKLVYEKDLLGNHENDQFQKVGFDLLLEVGQSSDQKSFSNAIFFLQVTISFWKIEKDLHFHIGSSSYSLTLTFTLNCYSNKFLTYKNFPHESSVIVQRKKFNFSIFFLISNFAFLFIASFCCFSMKRLSMHFKVRT